VKATLPETLTTTKENDMTELMAHCDTTRVTEAEVLAVPAPAWTKTWHPVSHAQVIEATQLAVNQADIGVVSKQYSLNKSGSKMFAVWNLDVGNGEMGYSLGIRQATDKSMVLGYTAGTNVFVCDNLCFSGSYMKFRMHTSGLDLEELRRIAIEALQGAVVNMDKFHAWHKNLANFYVPRTDLKQLAFDFATKGVFSGGQIGNFLECLDEERGVQHGTVLDGTTSLFAVHGACTRLMRNWNLLRTSEATAILNGITDDYLVAKAA